MRVVVVGQGYVGLPLAVRAAEVGHQVIGYDVDTRRVERLAAGESYVEDIPAARLRVALDSGHYRPSAVAKHCAGFDIAIVTVPTPLRDGVPDVSYIEEAARTLARYLTPGSTVVLESTTYPGTTEELFGPILEEGSGLTVGSDFHLGFSPERIDPGNQTWTFETTPKIVSGVDEVSLKVVKEFYDGIVETTVPVTSPKEAELAKLIENTFRHVNIALVNEVAMLAHDLDIDVWQAIDAAGSKPFGFMRFTPGPGVGGHCLPIDPSYLSWRVQRALGQSFRFVELANDINNHMPDYVVRRLTDALNQKRRAVNGSKILLLGLAYKKNTGDARESPAVRVAQLLVQLGAEVSAVDPHVVEEIHGLDERVRRVALSADEVAAADAVVLLSDHDEFDYELVRTNATYVLDTRRRLGGANVDII
ncbi:nucleotide sugar dehydrogenase [Planosporangium flavigriseum]|uniref:UDP-N-acetyl-D-glucosamine dehydrogenase n=1 Tax=Planosporangium flavigriseum TaxID=373681 RepID=A0A8J3LKS9_9ACTN|nr:nucleotide sugar dehydrogenase [Planosporangium flavigriseum]NJC65788.1 nucleotide sugar dehydrogenase [Planosporangium flavigriseum]GIG73642.1 UDP-N-acetyl-D-glucosamine dehydrogenase [Planosporangium flavigriseum]